MEKTKKGMNPIVKLAVVLFLVSAVTAAVLALTNELTKDTIAAGAARKTMEAFAAVMPEGAEPAGYDELDLSALAGVEEYGIIRSVSKAQLDAEQYVVELEFSGAQGMIVAAVGVTGDGTVTGVSIISHAETPGLGARAYTEPEFCAQYSDPARVPAGGDYGLTKTGGTIDGLTGATITSTAVTGAVNTAIHAVAALKG